MISSGLFEQTFLRAYTQDFRTTEFPRSRRHDVNFGLALLSISFKSLISLRRKPMVVRPNSPHGLQTTAGV